MPGDDHPLSEPPTLSREPVEVEPSPPDRNPLIPCSECGESVRYATINEDGFIEKHDDPEKTRSLCPECADDDPAAQQHRREMQIEQHRGENQPLSRFPEDA